jgi:hypothetical protein
MEFYNFLSYIAYSTPNFKENYYLIAIEYAAVVAILFYEKEKPTKGQNDTSIKLKINSGFLILKLYFTSVAIVFGIEKSDFFKQRQKHLLVFFI